MAPRLTSWMAASQAGLLASSMGTSCARPCAASALDRCDHAPSSTAPTHRPGGLGTRDAKQTCCWRWQLVRQPWLLHSVACVQAKLR